MLLSLGATLIAFAATSTALGTATVVNNCGFPVYYDSVRQDQEFELKQMPEIYSQQYSHQGNGISIKLAPNSDETKVSQFEFTWEGGKIWYDISNIDGEPFAPYGMSLVPSMQSDQDNPTCSPLNCSAYEILCKAAYNEPDDERTFVCNENSDLTMTLCSNGGNDFSTDSSRNASATLSAGSGTASRGTLDRRSRGAWSRNMHQHIHSSYIRN